MFCRCFHMPELTADHTRSKSGDKQLQAAFAHHKNGIMGNLCRQPIMTQFYVHCSAATSSGSRIYDVTQIRNVQGFIYFSTGLNECFSQEDVQEPRSLRTVSCSVIWWYCNKF